MGKVKPDLAGAYVSKVGGVAYYIKDGVNYVRSLSKSGANEGNRQSGFSSTETGANA